MFIALIGTPSSGKDTIAQYLISRHGFRRIELAKTMQDGANSPEEEDSMTESVNLLDLSKLQIDQTTTPPDSAEPLSFSSVDSLLNSVTKTWRTHYVTTDLQRAEDIQRFVKRPFFLLVAVDGPMMTRFEREKAKATRHGASLNLENFIAQHDMLMDHLPALPKKPQPQDATTPAPSIEIPPTISPRSSSATRTGAGLKRALAYAHLSIMNNFTSVPELEEYLEELNLLDGERLRPGWDTYFMTLASLASLRSNCMKRRVGALLVRSKRILSTGYNGTPRGLTNCNEGGCRRCNGSAKGGEALNECLCLHAEENALLEAGRERVGEDAILYCNTCPCLRCSVKIVQTGVKEVVYNLNYSMDAQSARVLKEGGVTLRQLVMPHTST
ncbi:Deoxycytidine monophosphate (dCMP) deaminase [Naganishia albida]|nr:Deoxycytidine monophosphate (dCMP) deaminase [Naganishia albida]